MSDRALTFAIPFYTGIEYLPRALQSIRAQIDPNWRAIVVDDCGPHADVEQVVRANGDDRIRYCRNDRNLGMAGSFNRCLELADTELVTLLHSDDQLLPSYCGTLRGAAADHPGAVAFYCRSHIIGPEGEPRFSFPDFVKGFINPSPHKRIVLEGEFGVRALLKGDFIMAPTLCFRKPVLGARRFTEGLKFVLDIQLTTGLLLDGEKIVGLPEVCYLYRRHEHNATSQYTRSLLRFEEESTFYDRMLPIVRARGWGKCVALATEKRIIKLNLGFRILNSVVGLHLGQVRRELALLRQLQRRG